MKYLIFYFLFLSFSVNAQNSADALDESLIGFACFDNGRETKPVKKISAFLTKKKYDNLRNLLKSKNNAERILAAFVCTKLYELEKIDLNDQDLIKIDEINDDETLVSICSGCLYFEKVAMRNLFEKQYGMIDEAENWFKNHIK